MSLQPIQFGTLASSEQVNDNFEYLDGRITDTASTISGVESNLSSQIQTVNNNKADRTLSNVTSLSDAIKALLSGAYANKDLSNVTGGIAGALTADDKKAIAALSMPNYSAGVSITTNTDYTCTAEGWILLYDSNFQSGHRYFTINGTQYTFSGSGGNYIDSNFAIIPVSTGDVVKLTGGIIKFFPMKGVN